MNINLKKYGINLTTLTNFNKNHGINFRIKIFFLKKTIKKIFKQKYKNICTEQNLFEKINKNISFYKKIKNFRGTRHLNNYPVRGQRTHTNAKQKIFKQKQFN
jgi:ribosomal protein S13